MWRRLAALPKGPANTPTISQAAPDSFLPRWGTDVQPAFLTDRRAVRPGAGQQLPRLSWQGPFPATRRSLGPVLAPSGLRCGPRWAGGGFGEGKWCFPQLQRKANSRYPPSSGGKRNGAQPRCSPHRDGSGRRQIPRPFGRRDEGHTCYSQQTKKQPTYGGRPWIVPARRTKGQSKGFDQRERVAVFCLLFFKRVSAGCRGA